MIKVYVPSFEAVLDVYGTIRGAVDGAAGFVVWNTTLTPPRFDFVSVRECVPYDGEMLPSQVSSPVAEPGEDEGLVSEVIPGERYEAKVCDECEGRFNCFPSIFPIRPLITRKDIEGTLLVDRKLTGDDAFREQLKTIQATKDRIRALRESLEKYFPGLTVEGIGTNPDFDDIDIKVRIENPDSFFNGQMLPGREI